MYVYLSERDEVQISKVISQPGGYDSLQSSFLQTKEGQVERLPCESPQTCWRKMGALKTVIKYSDDTPTNKICRRAPRAAHERDQITNEIA